MLDAISIQNLALIKSAQLTFSPGLTCITGESGSGKTAFLHGIQLISGERAMSEWVRDGADALKTSAQVSEDATAAQDPTIVKRELTAGGRGTITIDGEMANLKMLGARMAPLFDFCGQHEHQQLLGAKGQRELFDAFAHDALQELQEAYTQAFCAHREAYHALEDLIQRANASEQQLDQARYQLGRIGEVHPVAGEDDSLKAELTRLESADALLQGAEAARASIADEEGALELLNSAKTELAHAVQSDPELGELYERLESVTIELDDLATQFRRYRDSVELNPHELTAKQERLAAIQGLMRSFGPTLDAVLATEAAAKELVDAHDSSDELLRVAREHEEATRETLTTCAQALAQAEKTQADVLSHAITNKLEALLMGSAAVQVEVTLAPQDCWTEKTPTTLEFLYRPGKDLAVHPLKRIASGGELSRVMLAAKAVESARASASAQTLVFDEVDAGVGGVAANALAQMLKELSQTHQVICVTHLAQVAVCADTHYVVSRDENTTSFQQVDGEERELEIARMLAGTLSEESIQHARSLIHEHASNDSKHLQ